MNLFELEEKLGIKGYFRRYKRLKVITFFKQHPNRPFIDLWLYSKRELNPTEVSLILMKFPLGLEVIHWLVHKANTTIKAPDGKILKFKEKMYMPLFKVMEIVEIGESIEPKIKEFSPELYAENDRKSKKVAIHFFSSIFDCKVKSDKEVYVYDLLMTDHFGKDLTIEVERKKMWEGYEFPFKTFDIPFRKNKNESELIVIFNVDYTALAMIKMSDVKSSPIERKNTIYSEAERFFKIPLCNVKFFELHEGQWYRDYVYKLLLEDGTIKLF